MSGNVVRMIRDEISSWNDRVASALKGTPFQKYWEDTEAVDWEYAKRLTLYPEKKAEILVEWEKTLWSRRH